MKKTILLSSVARRLKNISQLLNWREAHKLVSIDFELKELSIKNGCSVIILAPHPDDDIFGLGGLIALLCKIKCSIHVVYMCNGDSGTVSGARDAKLTAERKKEATAALAHLAGTITTEFLDQPDGLLKVTSELSATLSTILKKQRPDVIVAPWFGDNHEDHQATFQIMQKSLTYIPSISILLYEVWTPLIPNRYIVIDDYIDTKIAAINEHSSQLKSHNYRDAIIGLNAYRAGMIGTGRYVECFIELTSKQLDTICAIY